MDLPRLAIVGGSVLLATLVVVLVVRGDGPARGHDVLLFWTIVTFLVAGIVLWLRTRS